MTDNTQTYIPPILYYSPTCEQCQKVTNFLQRHNIQGIEFADITEGNNAQELVDVSGQDTLPVFYFNGKFAIGDEQCIAMISNLVMNGGKTS